MKIDNELRVKVVKIDNTTRKCDVDLQSNSQENMMMIDNEITGKHENEFQSNVEST